MVLLSRPNFVHIGENVKTLTGVFNIVVLVTHVLLPNHHKFGRDIRCNQVEEICKFRDDFGGNLFVVDISCISSDLIISKQFVV